MQTHTQQGEWLTRQRKEGAKGITRFGCFTRSFEVRGGKDIGSRASQTGFKPQANEYELVGCAALKSGEKEGGGSREPLPIP